MVEDECGAGDGADLAWAGGDVLQDAPADGEQAEPAFAQEEHGTPKRVAGAGIEVDLLAAGWLLASWPVCLAFGWILALAWGKIRRGGGFEDVLGAGAGGAGS